MLTTLGVYAASRRSNDGRSQAPNPLGVSLFAGAVWPLLLVGLVQLGFIVVYAKVQSRGVPVQISSSSPLCSLKILPLNAFGGQSGSAVGGRADVWG